MSSMTFSSLALEWYSLCDPESEGWLIESHCSEALLLDAFLGSHSDLNAQLPRLNVCAFPNQMVGYICAVRLC